MSAALVLMCGGPQFVMAASQGIGAQKARTMQPFFILSYPRSRTAWLSTYLNHGPVFAFHEAWKLVKTAKQLRALMECKSKDGGPVVNVDCSNWFFLEELMEEFPEARYIRIDRDVREVESSARESFGPQDYTSHFTAYARAIARNMVTPSLTVDFATWTPDVSRAIWNDVSGGAEIDPDWHRQLHEQWIELTPDAVRKELAMGLRGDLSHISRRMLA